MDIVGKIRLQPSKAQQYEGHVEMHGTVPTGISCVSFAKFNLRFGTDLQAASWVYPVKASWHCRTCGGSGCRIVFPQLTVPSSCSYLM